MSSELVRLAGYDALDVTDPNYANAGGYLVKKGDYLLSMRRALPASAGVAYTSPANTGNTYSIVLFDVGGGTVVRGAVPYYQVYGLQTFYPGEVRGHPLLDGDVLYTGHSGALVALDVSDPQAISELDRFVDATLASQPRIRNVAMIDSAGILWAGHAGGLASEDGIVGMDVSDPTSIVYSPGRTTNGAGTGGLQGGFTIARSSLGWGDRWLAVLDYRSGTNNGVRIWDTTNVAGSAVYAAWSGISAASGASRPQSLALITVDGVDHMIVTLSEDGHVLFDVSDPTAPVQVGGYAAIGSGGTSNNNQSVETVPPAPWLVVGTIREDTDSYVYLLDYSTPASPVVLTKTKTGDSGSLSTSNIHYIDTFCEDDRAYFADVSGRAAMYEVTELGRWTVGSVAF